MEKPADDGKVRLSLPDNYPDSDDDLSSQSAGDLPDFTFIILIVDMLSQKPVKSNFYNQLVNLPFLSCGGLGRPHGNIFLTGKSKGVKSFGQDYLLPKTIIT